MATMGKLNTQKTIFCLLFNFIVPFEQKLVIFLYNGGIRFGFANVTRNNVCSKYCHDI